MEGNAQSLPSVDRDGRETQDLAPKRGNDGALPSTKRRANLEGNAQSLPCVEAYPENHFAN